MRSRFLSWGIALAGLTLSVLAGAGDPLGVTLTFAARNKCQGTSPEIRLTRVPPGTAAFKVQLIDEDVPTFQHWTQTLPATGPVIPAGAGKGIYYGPCPPRGKHTYRVTVTALDAAGQPLAQGEFVTQTDRH